MAGSIAALEFSSSSANVTSYTTGSVAVTTGRLLTAQIETDLSGAGTPSTPTISNTGTALTWTQQGNTPVGSTDRFTIWTAPTLTTESITITFDWGAETQNEGCWGINECSGLDATGTVVQTNLSTGASTAPATTLAAFADSTNNLVFVAVGTGGSPGFTPESPYVELGRSAQSDMTEAAWDTGEDLTPSGTLSASSDWAFVAIELKAATADTNVNGTVDNLILTEYAANVNAANNIAGTTDALVITEYTATVSLGVNINGTVDVLTLTEYSANVNAAINRTGSLASLSITEYVANINAAINRAATFDSLVITPYQATVSLVTGTNIAAGFDALVITPYAGNVNAEINISSGVASLIITAYAATVGLAIGPTIDGASTDVITTNYGEGSYYSIGSGTYYKF